MGRVIPFVACVLVTTVASATVLVPAEFTEIVGGSQIIAHARIIDVRPQWADGRRWVDTIVTAEVLTFLKGGTTSEDSISFKVPGGRIGRYRTLVVGAPVFARGDEAILFLKRHDDELPDIFGLNQGVYRIRVDTVSGQKVVVPPPVMKLDDRPDPERVTRGSLDRRPLGFEAFGARVRDVMAAKSAPKGGR
jgi:hypothetical protein